MFSLGPSPHPHDERLHHWLARASRARSEHLLIRYTDGSATGVQWQSTRGGHDSFKLDVRQIVQDALNGGHHKLLLAHNHPSGVAEPSKQDLMSTRALERCCHPLGIEIEDHLIVGNNGTVFSFREAGLL